MLCQYQRPLRPLRRAEAGRRRGRRRCAESDSARQMGKSRCDPVAAGEINGEMRIEGRSTGSLYQVAESWQIEMAGVAEAADRLEQGIGLIGLDHVGDEGQDAGSVDLKTSARS